MLVQVCFYNSKYNDVYYSSISVYPLKCVVYGLLSHYFKIEKNGEGHLRLHVI